MPPEKVSWFVHTLRTDMLGNLEKFKQEHPRHAEEAFIASGGPFFPQVYQDTHNDPRLGVFGWLRFKKAEKYRLYILGADTASGSEAKASSFSAAVILDVTEAVEAMERRGDDVHKDLARAHTPLITTAASFRQKLPPYRFAQEIYELAKEYHALIVPEVWRGGRLGNMDSDGQVVIDVLLMREWPHIYRRITRDKIGNQLQQTIGFVTTGQTRPVMLARMHQFVGMGWWKPTCPRLKSEMNTFRYNEKGRPEAPEGEWDDLVMSTALAMAGLDQVDDYRKDIQFSKKPRSNREYIEFEASTGMDPDSYDGDWDDEPLAEELLGHSGGPPSTRVYRGY